MAEAMNQPSCHSRLIGFGRRAEFPIGDEGLEIGDIVEDSATDPDKPRPGPYAPPLGKGLLGDPQVSRSFVGVE